MPTAYLKKVSKKKGISIDRAEELWDKAKKLAASQGHEDEYDYITGIFKKMIGERLTFSEFHMIFEEGEPTNSISSGGTDHHSASDGGKPGNMMRRKKKMMCDPEDDDCDMIDEKWGIKLKIDKSERGKYKGKTVEDLKKELAKLKKSGPHKKGSPEYEKMMELMFAIRAKTGWGKVSESFLSEAPKLGSLNRGDAEYYDDEEVDDNPEEDDKEEKDQLKEFWVRNKKHLRELLLKLKSMKYDVSNPRKILNFVQKLFDTAYYDKDVRASYDDYYDVVTKTAQQQIADEIRSKFTSKNDQDFAFALYDYFDGSQILGFLNSEKLRKKLEKELNI